ncbi:MAG TPA: glycosyltransferase family 4 protein, partial [Acidobacteriaceae bacterium]|nr:glycosyltransferase family 4 protein [Acidobacteriaceae bacterium]
MNAFALSDLQDQPRVYPGKGRKARVAYFITHPIQYQAPLLRRIAKEPDIDMTTFFGTGLSADKYIDPGFGIPIEWDVPLLEGYQYEFLPELMRTKTITRFAWPLNYGILSRLRRGRFDVAWIFGYNRVFCIHAILACRLLGLPVILRAEPNLFSRPRSRFKLFVKSALASVLKAAVDCVVPIGEANEAYWKHYFGGDFPMYRMPYTVDNDFFQKRAQEAAPHRENLRARLGLRPDLPVVLYASKLTTRKRCGDLVEAFIRLAPAPGVDPAACLLIIGDGEERAHLEERVRQSGLSNIRFLGFRNQTELPAYYDLSDVFVLPSCSETWGLVVNEVMNAGRPVIVTSQIGCQPDLVHDGANGFVVPVSDVPALSAALRRLIEDPRLRASMGENSLRII